MTQISHYTALHVAADAMKRQFLAAEPSIQRQTYESVVKALDLWCRIDEAVGKKSDRHFLPTHDLIASVHSGQEFIYLLERFTRKFMQERVPVLAEGITDSSLADQARGTTNKTLENLVYQASIACPHHALVPQWMLEQIDILAEHSIVRAQAEVTIQGDDLMRALAEKTYLPRTLIAEKAGMIADLIAEHGEKWPLERVLNALSVPLWPLPEGHYIPDNRFDAYRFNVAAFDDLLHIFDALPTMAQQGRIFTDKELINHMSDAMRLIIRECSLHQEDHAEFIDLQTAKRYLESVQHYGLNMVYTVRHEHSFPYSLIQGFYVMAAVDLASQGETNLRPRFVARHIDKLTGKAAECVKMFKTTAEIDIHDAIVYMSDNNETARIVDYVCDLVPAAVARNGGVPIAGAKVGA